MKDSLIPNYTPVRLTHNKVITGFTDGICIRGRAMDIVEYNFIYWAGLERKSEWVMAHEVEVIPIKEPMGFNKGNTDVLKV